MRIFRVAGVSILGGPESDLDSHEWQPTVFLKGDITKEVKRIKQAQGSNLHVYGSGQLIQTLIRHELIDEFWLKIFPITLGSGKRLFADGTVPMTLKVTDTAVTPNGVIFVNYQREKRQGG